MPVLCAAPATATVARTVTIGSDLSAASDTAQNCPAGGCTQGLIQLNSQTITAPCTGVVTSWAVRGYSSSGSDQVKLRVLHPAGGSSYTGAGTSAAVTLTSSDAVHKANTNLPIAKADAIGLDVPTNLDFTLNSTASAPKTAIWYPPLADSSTEDPSFTNSFVGLNIQATIACASAAAPGTKLTASKINASKHRAKFSFASTGDATRFECALVMTTPGHPTPRRHFVSCSTPKRYTNLKPGEYRFFVRAVGPGGPDPTPASARFRI